MKRRDFLVQSVSASAVILGAGYASIDIINRRAPRYEESLDSRALKAALKVSDGPNPMSDEGVLQIAETAAEPLVRPDAPAYSRPASSYAQQRAEALIPEAFPGSTSPSQPDTQQADTPAPEIQVAASKVEPVAPVEEIVLTEEQHFAAKSAAVAVPETSASTVEEKVANFESNFTDDVILSENEYRMLVQTLERVNRIQDYVGFGNFNVLSFDEALQYAKYSPRIGNFTKEEKEFLDMLFFYDSSRLGFFGEKVIAKQTNVIAKADIEKMPGTGHYVYKGYPKEFYLKIRQQVGDTLILTSGIRNIMKQYQLFMAKTVQANGNLSRASRSLAPPGHSYHAIGDYDVGQVGGGLSNFTSAFARTDEFKRLQDLGYVKIRYTANNRLGVRYEPWHIRVV